MMIRSQLKLSCADLLLELCSFAGAGGGVGCGSFGNGTQSAVGPGMGSSSLEQSWSSVYSMDILILEQG